MRKLSTEDRQETARRLRKAAQRLAELVDEATEQGEWADIFTGIRVENGRAVLNLKMVMVTTK